MYWVGTSSLLLFFTGTLASSETCTVRPVFGRAGSSCAPPVPLYKDCVQLFTLTSFYSFISRLRSSVVGASSALSVGMGVGMTTNSAELQLMLRHCTIITTATRTATTTTRLRRLRRGRLRRGDVDEASSTTKATTRLRRRRWRRPRLRRGRRRRRRRRRRGRRRRRRGYEPPRATYSTAVRCQRLFLAAACERHSAESSGPSWILRPSQEDVLRKEVLPLC